MNAAEILDEAAGLSAPPTVCAWCEAGASTATWPASHGLCPECAELREGRHWFRGWYAMWRWLELHGFSREADGGRTYVVTPDGWEIAEECHASPAYVTLIRTDRSWEGPIEDFYHGVPRP